MQSWIVREQPKHFTVQKKLIECSDNYICVPIPKISRQILITWNAFHNQHFKKQVSKNASLSFFCFGDEWKESENKKPCYKQSFFNLTKLCKNPTASFSTSFPLVFASFNDEGDVAIFKHNFVLKMINNNDIKKFICKVPWLLRKIGRPI